ncbi:integral peroxisomal membrane peroxin [Diaporthe helianthi]|uniref:Integral peroxisomal membrane peroxin n=1 Tax=Diaporthe helianthi TaxID=158607 RepID=A0A2P5I1G7_DIAHE|nr:integral peroxisomal membrane peroxin [Diaporthe helianthi]
MSTPRRQRGDTLDSSSSTHSPNRNDDGPASYLGAAAAEPKPTYASFSPATLSSSQPVSAAKRLSTILVHQKSPLLLATPPQVTRALAYSHPFLLPLNKLVGLLSWTTSDPWESFLMVAVFWATVLYGDVAVRFAGPVVVVLIVILGMYGRRFSPLSSSGWNEDSGAGGGSAPKSSKGKVRKAPTENSGATPANPTAGTGGGQQLRAGSEATHTKHQKTLDEIVETLKELTARCNILMEPLLELTDYLSTQRTATSATTRPALTTLFVRILMCTPFWAALTLPPFRIISTRRVVLVFGTLVLTWHARVVKAGRTILWRSASVRKFVALITGLDVAMPEKANKDKNNGVQRPAFEKDPSKSKEASSNVRAQAQSELTKAIRRARGTNDAGVRFTFILYENQRRWVGLGWTNSLFAYERAAWTDEHNNPVPPKDKFELPGVDDDSGMRWRWVRGSRWRVDGVSDESANGGASGAVGAEWNYDGDDAKNGWIFYDNKWQNGRRGQDGWGRWTRRRKWYRDAELVEVDSDEETEPAKEVSHDTQTSPKPTLEPRQTLPPMPKTPTLAPPITTFSPNYETMSMPDVHRTNDSLKEVKQEDARSPVTDKEKEKDDASSVLSTSSRSMRLLPSLRRRVTDNTAAAAQAMGNKHHHRRDDSSVTSSPRSSVVSPYSAGVLRDRRTSEVQSEDDQASLGPGLGLEISKDRRGGSWGIGDEAVMGLE